jgi:hypothetical protein
MTIEDKKLAEQLLKYLCLGAKVEGQMFYGLRLLLSTTKNNKKRIKGQISLVIENNYAILDELPKEGIPVMKPVSTNIMQDYEHLVQLGLGIIEDIYLGEEVPHLYIHFHNGKILFINGLHDKDESWQVEVINEKDYKEGWGVMAMSQNDISYWAPEDMMKFL